MAPIADCLSSCNLNRASRNEFAVPEPVPKFGVLPTHNYKVLVLCGMLDCLTHDSGALKLRFIILGPLNS